MKKPMLIVVAFLTLLLVGSVLWATQKKASRQPTVYTTRQECEDTTGKTCSFSVCDFKCKVSFKGWLPQKMDKNEGISAVNGFLEAADTQILLQDWKNTIVCGPMDEVLGYRLQQSGVIIAKDQATKLKESAAAANLNINTFGMGFSIDGDGWSIRVINGDEESGMLSAELSTLNEPVANYPDNEGVLCG